MKKKTSISYDDWIIKKLKSDPALAREYLQTAVDEASEPGGKQALLLAMKQVAEAQGVGKVAKAADIHRESLSRALSTRGNPRIDTLLAIINAMGLRLIVMRHPLTT